MHLYIYREILGIDVQGFLLFSRNDGVFAVKIPA